jgi:bifunctional enzyme CysN/CysC
MNRSGVTIADDVREPDRTHAAPVDSKGLLRVITCGSVDDGKSTLIGRLLYDCNLLSDDQRDALVRDSQSSHNTGSEGLDFSLLVDGLEAEREQAITIDVAYRYVETAKRKFIFADTPGHIQYTRNMATGASTAESAIVLIDARKGIVEQTRRHVYIATLMGVRYLILAINKMDAVGFDRSVYASIVEDFEAWMIGLGVRDFSVIPLSALEGDNVARPSQHMSWYEGPTLLQCLETVDVGGDDANGPLRFPVQWVSRPNQDFRGYCGTVAAGVVGVGDPVAVLPSGLISQVSRIVTMDGDLDVASAGDAITLVLADDLDAGRGDIIASSADRPEIADQFAVNVIWMGDEPLLPGRSYILQIGPRTAGCQITSLRYKINVATLEHTAAQSLLMNEIAHCHISLDQAIAFEPYEKSQHLGGFILIDRWSNATIACGMIIFALRRAHNLHWQAITIDKAVRAAIKKQKPCILWFTGLSASGKSTIANLVEKKLVERGCHTYLLDGDNVRHGMNRDLGFTVADRVENIRRIGEMAKLFVDAGIIVLSAFISPFRQERELARNLVAADEFLEFYIDTPIEICERRDPKGLYKKARAGDLPGFTGIDSPYEPPMSPDMVLPGGDRAADLLADDVIALLKARGYID